MNLKLAPVTDINLGHILVKYGLVCKKCTRHRGKMIMAQIYFY